MKNQLKPYPTETTNQLVTTILRRIPQFVKELKNEKLIVAIHYSTNRYDQGSGYRWHRFQRHLANAAWAGNDSPRDAIVPYTIDEYREICCKPSRKELHHAAVVGMVCAMGDIFASVCTLYHPATGYYHNFGEPNTVSTGLVELAKEKLYAQSMDFERNFLSDRLDALYDERTFDLHAFLVFVFRYLRDEGYEWQYRSDYLRASKRIEAGDFRHRDDNDEDDDEKADERWCKPADMEPEDLGPDADQYNQNNIVDISFQTEYLKFVEEGPEPSVTAYIQVYGVEPDGYPPRMDEY